MISVYSKKTDTELNIRRLESIEKYCRLINWGRANPTRFIEEIFKIQLLDYQKWLILNTWVAEHAVWVCSRNAGKSFLGGVYMMTRNLLFPKYETYIMSNTGYQSKSTFLKMENIAKRNIASLVGTSDVFYDEIIKGGANQSGFVHGNSQYSLELYNGSRITTLVGKEENVVGARSNLNFYDEAGKIADQYFALTVPFTTQNTDFKTGAGYDNRVYPLNIPTQNIYASSAEGVDSYLWKRYSDCFRNMLIGVPGFFCADINCEMPLHPHLNGTATTALLKQSEIDSALRTNEAKALREYYNIFDTSGGSDAAVQRPVILRNEGQYLPIANSAGENRQYVLCYDPALQADNSFVLIGEVFKDEEKGWKGRIVNGINLIEVLGPNDKHPLNTVQQLDWLRTIMLGYNGRAPEWDNVEMYIDAGTGGGGRHYANLLMMDWEYNGLKHAGLIDLNDERSAEQKSQFPNAKDKLHMMEPARYKTQMFSDLSEMMQLDLIELPPALPNRGELEMEDGRWITLTDEEKRALLEIDLMKEEIMSIQKFKTAAGNIQYKLPPSKERKMHDDRAYCLAMFGHHLAELRRAEFIKSERPTMDYSDYLKAIAGQGGGGKKPATNPFSGAKNPFAKR